MIGAGIMGAGAPNSPVQEIKAAAPDQQAGRVVFEVTAEVDAETLIDAFGERCAIVIHDAGMTREVARKVALDGLRRMYRIFRRDPVQ